MKLASLVAASKLADKGRKLAEAVSIGAGTGGGGGKPERVSAGGPGSGPHPGAETGAMHEHLLQNGFKQQLKVGGQNNTYEHPKIGKILLHDKDTWTHIPAGENGNKFPTSKMGIGLASLKRRMSAGGLNAGSFFK